MTCRGLEPISSASSGKRDKRNPATSSILLAFVLLSAVSAGCLQEASESVFGDPAEYSYLTSSYDIYNETREEWSAADAALRNYSKETGSKEAALEKVRSAQRVLVENRDEVDALEPPPKFVSAHTHLFRMHDEGLRALDLVEFCVEDDDIVACERSEERFEKSAEHADRFLELTAV